MIRAEKVTLDNCDREPIHVPSAIQPHGVLFACRPADLVVVQTSENVSSFFGVAPADVLERPLSDLFDPPSAEHLAALVAVTELREANPFRLVSRRGDRFDAVAHRAGEALVIEVEPAAVASGRSTTVGSFDPRLRASLLRLQGARDIQTLTTIAATEVRTLTGFDRVMVYRFDADWNGEVVAESKRDELASFLHQHYPASDIPAQARRLYTVNWLRNIGDVSYRPVALVPSSHPLTSAPLDMSHSVLRSVSPIHIEYLRNMGVTASMSISLVIDGELAGLIACHHYSGPRIVPATVRDTAEYVGYALSWQLRVVEGADRAEHVRAVQQHEAEVVRSIAIASELADGLDTPALLAIAEASGAAVVLDEGIRRIGKTPSVDEIRAIVAWLAKDGPDDVYARDHLANDIPEAEAWEDVAGGMLAVTIARDLGEYILWFRPAAARVVDWAGKPEKVLTEEEGKPARLSPRGSFALWQEVVKGRSTPWQPWQVEAASRLRRAILGGVRRRSVQLRDINERLLAADRAKDDFIATVSHELRTPLNAINGWTNLLRSGAVDANQTRHALEVIARNVQVQQQLVEDLLDVSRMTSGKLTLDVERVDFTALVATSIDASSLAMAAKSLAVERAFDDAKCHVRGDPVRLRQVVTNLLNNAVKFTPKGGSITVSLHRLESDVELVVRDSGQGIDPPFLPHVFEAFRQQDSAMNRRSQGLGLGLAIVKKLVELHGGRIEAESAGLGLGASFRVRIPITAFSTSPSSGRVSPIPVEAEERSDLDGVKVLVVEDDNDSRELILRMLEHHGGKVTVASDAKSAFVAFAGASFDIIVSDVGLPEMDGLQLMRMLRSEPVELGGQTPAIALTAYTRAVDRTAALQAGFQAHVPKPVDADELVATIASVLNLPRKPR